MRRAAPLAALAALLLALSATAPFAAGAGYGRGLFTGKGTSQFDDDRPKTPVELKVKGSHVRMLKLVFVFDCAADGSVQRLTVDTRFFRVRTGPAGGGAFFTDKLTPRQPVVGDNPLDVTIHLALREKRVSGTADATLFVDKLPCEDDVTFSAKQR